MYTGNDSPKWLTGGILWLMFMSLVFMSVLGLVKLAESGMKHGPGTRHETRR